MRQLIHFSIQIILHVELLLLEIFEWNECFISDASYREILVSYDSYYST